MGLETLILKGKIPTPGGDTQLGNDLTIDLRSSSAETNSKFPGWMLRHSRGGKKATDRNEGSFCSPNQIPRDIAVSSSGDNAKKKGSPGGNQAGE